MMLSSVSSNLTRSMRALDVTHAKCCLIEWVIDTYSRTNLIGGRGSMTRVLFIDTKGASVGHLAQSGLQVQSASGSLFV